MASDQDEATAGVAIEVIQGGINSDRSGERRDPIPLERTRDTGLRHRDGAISMARFTPDSAVSGVFICINDQPGLDFCGMRNLDGQGFAAFWPGGGWHGDRARHRAEASAGQALEPPVPMVRAWRIGRS